MKLQSTFQYETVQGFKFGSYPFGKPRIFVHVYFLDGLLIDTGHSNMQKEVIETLKGLPVNQIFVTHHHEDHSGNLGDLQQLFACPSYASSRCVEIMKDPPGISFAQWMTWGAAQPNFQLQVEEKEIKTPNHTLQLIPIPGHAEDMLGLWDRERSWFFSADLFVFPFIRYFLPSESMHTQIESIRKVLKLEFEVMFCNHNPQFVDPKSKLRQKLQFLEDFYGKAAKFHKKGFSIRAIMKEMGLKEGWPVRIMSTGALSTRNMVKSVIRDEESKNN